MGALRGREQRIDGGEGARAVGLDRVEGAGGGEAFQHALVDGARIDAAAEIGKVGERPFAARGNDALDRLPADAAQRGQRVDRSCCLRHRTRTPERLIDGGSTLSRSRSASARNSESLSVLPMSSVIDAARNSTG